MPTAYTFFSALRGDPTRRSKRGYISVKGAKASEQNKELDKIVKILDDCFKYFKDNNRISTALALYPTFSGDLS